jgi:Zn-dependent M28 family amino/carboxypeptidase
MYEGDEPLPSYYETRMTLPGDTYSSRVPVFTISMRAAARLLESSGIDIKKFEEENEERSHSVSKEIENTRVHFKTNVESRMITARNVVGVLEGENTDDCIVLGAHYDHLGKHGGYIWNGADDNASGTVGIMTLAKACMATGTKPEKTIIFAAWTGEEKGLWGSRYFADHPWDDKKVILNLNLDMISRDNEDDTLGNKVSMSYTQAYSMLEKFTQLNRDNYDLDLDIRFRPSERARGGSDHAPFAQKGIPYFYFMAGFPPEYHQPDDHIDLVNFSKMTNIIRLCYLNVWDFANTDDWME